jgi:hypothetical protein
MKNTIISLVYLSFFLFQSLFYSCSKEIEIDFKNYKPNIVVSSIFCNDKPFIFHFSTTQSPIHTNNLINDSIYLALYEDNNKILETKFKSNSLTTDIYPKPGCIYQLKAYIEGFDSIYACDTLPYQTYFGDGTILQPISIDRYGTNISQVRLTISDLKYNRDYYELLFQDIQYDSSVPITDPVLINEGDVQYKPTSYFFSDELFDGQDYSMVINRDLGLGIRVWAILRATSRNYYLYRKFLTRHLFTQPTKDVGAGAFIFKGEPQTMYNNIINGYGIFAGYVETSPYLLQQIEK